jgi:L-rhamnose isomerase
MVPYVSASKDAKYNLVFHSTSHADLAMRRDIIEKVMEIFGIEKEENNEK